MKEIFLEGFWQKFFFLSFCWKSLRKYRENIFSSFFFGETYKNLETWTKSARFRTLDMTKTIERKKFNHTIFTIRKIKPQGLFLKKLLLQKI